jgi:sugar phosphate isomerase/epimerase
MQPMPVPALSTMWMQLRHATLTEYITAARAMGFEQIELSHVVTTEMLQSLLPGQKGIRVLHHPCPNDGGVPELSDPEETRRARAMAALRQTLRWAARLGAEAVVLHLGIVAGLDRRWENALRARWQAGQAGTTEYAALYRQVEQLRAAQAAPFLDAARRSLAEIIPEAAAFGLRLGLENGEWLAAIPNLAEWGSLLAEFDTPTVGAWFDTGHATIVERLSNSSTPLCGWAQLAGSRLVGLHYHDVAGLRDHLTPGLGTVDFQALRPFISPEALPTCEFDWYFNTHEIRAGVEHLAACGLIAWDP